MVESSRSNPSMVRVELRTIGGAIFQTVYTDASGHFRFNNVPTGSYFVEIRMPGYEPVRQPIRVEFHPIINLVLTLKPTNFGQPKGQVATGSDSVVSVRQLLIPNKARDEYRKGAKNADQGKTEEAIKHWKKAIKIYPKYAESYMQLGRVYADRGEFDKATEFAYGAIDIDGRNADSYVVLGYVYLKAKDNANATKAFQKAVRLSDTNWFSQLWLGKLLLDQKEAQDAYPHLLRASELKPDMPTTYVILYNDLLMLHRTKDALATLDAFLERFPKNPLAKQVREKRKKLAKSLEQEH